MAHLKPVASLFRAGLYALAAFPVILLVSFGLHFAGEFRPEDAFRLRLTYEQPSPERFMELFRSGSLVDFVLPHLLIYLALPMLILGAASLGALLFERRPLLALAGVLSTMVGLVYMGGVFGSWLGYSEIGRVKAEEVAGAIPALAALIHHPPMLTLTSSLAALSLIGIMLLVGGLLRAHAIPRWPGLLILVGNATILAFMDIDNLMLLGSAAWLLGALPLLRARPAWLIQGDGARARAS